MMGLQDPCDIISTFFLYPNYHSVFSVLEITMVQICKCRAADEVRAGHRLLLPLSLAQVESFSLVRGLVGAKVWLLLEEIHPDNGQRLEKAIR